MVTGETCPTCGQHISDDIADEVFKTINKDKSEHLKAINSTGKANVEEIKRVSVKIKDFEKQLKDLPEKVNPEIPVEPSKIVAIRQRIKSLQAELETAKDSADKTAEDKINADIDNIEKEIAEKEKLVAGTEALESNKQRVAELQKEEEELSKAYMNNMSDLTMVERLEQIVSERLSDKCQELFGGTVSFKLFEKQINEGMKPCCETMFDGRPWIALSTGERIKTGLAIIKKLSEHFKLQPPIFVDNSESVTELPKLDQQVICLRAEEGVDELTLSNKN